MGKPLRKGGECIQRRSSEARGRVSGSSSKVAGVNSSGGGGISWLLKKDVEYLLDTQVGSSGQL